MLDFRLVHDGKNWQAACGDIAAKGDSLSDLDRNLEKELVRRDLTKGLSEFKVRMTFDNKCMPPFMRQYANHYFNRVVQFTFDS
jgi:hypothetical protein